MRTAVILGLHVNVPESQVPDRAVREHRIRLWWTAYVLDRMSAVKLTQPASVPDDIIETEFPSNNGLTDPDFGDPELLTANIKLAQHASHVISEIYRRRKDNRPFSHRVQKVVRDLWGWFDQLPEHLRLDSKALSITPSKLVERMHLTFNQVSILRSSLDKIHTKQA